MSQSDSSIISTDEGFPQQHRQFAIYCDTESENSKYYTPTESTPKIRTRGLRERRPAFHTFTARNQAPEPVSEVKRTFAWSEFLAGGVLGMIFIIALLFWVTMEVEY